MAATQADIDTLTEAIVTPDKAVRDRDQSVESRSLEEQLRARKIATEELAAASGTVRRRIRYRGAVQSGL